MTLDKYDFTSMIPEYMQGCLSDEVAKVFEKELERNSDLRSEVAEYSAFASLYQEVTDEAEPDAEPVFARIEATISTQEQSFAVSSHAGNETVSLAQRFLNTWRRLMHSLWTPWTLAAIQAAVIVILLYPGTYGDTYRTLNGSAGTVVKVEQQLLNIVFTPSATELDMRSLLISIDGTIVAGPSTQGRYVIGIAAGESVDAARAVLKQSPIIRFVDVVL